MKPMSWAKNKASGSAASLTRRELAAVLSVPSLLAQTPIASGPLPQNPQEELEATRELVRQNLSQLAKVPLPMATEPATHFKA